MQIPPGAEKFTFPHPQPVSPPVTPASSQSRQSSISQISPIFAKRYGFIGPSDSPPEHIDPTGMGHQFSYTPPQRGISSENSSESDEPINSDDEASDPEVESYSEVAASVRQTSVRVLAVDDETDFTVEEMSENDMDDSNTKPVQPDHIEDAESVKGNQDTTEVDQILAHRLKRLNCDNSSEQREFEEVQQKRFRQKKNRWSKGGNHKRNHDESIGSGTDDDDVEPLDAQQPGSSARRLRRRTQGPEDKPRTSLLFDDPPPAEIEELKHFDDDQDETSPLTSHRSDRPNNMHKGDHYEKAKYFVETTVHSTDEEDIQEVGTQYWRYSTDVDSDLSRPSSSCAAKVPRPLTSLKPQMSTTSSRTHL